MNTRNYFKWIVRQLYVEQQRNEKVGKSHTHTSAKTVTEIISTNFQDQVQVTSEYEAEPAAQNIFAENRAPILESSTSPILQSFRKEKRINRIRCSTQGLRGIWILAKF